MRKSDMTPDELEDAEELVREWKNADRTIDDQSLRLLPLMAGGCVAAILSGKLVDRFSAWLFLLAAITFSAAILVVLVRLRIRVFHLAPQTKSEAETATRLESLINMVFFIFTALGLVLALYGAGVQVKNDGKQSSTSPPLSAGGG